MRAPPPPPVILTAVSAFQRRASAHLLQRPGAGTMSLANLSGIESMSGERQGWPFGAVLGRSIRSIGCCGAAMLQTSRGRAGRDIPPRPALYLSLLSSRCTANLMEIRVPRSHSSIHRDKQTVGSCRLECRTPRLPKSLSGEIMLDCIVFSA